MEEASIQVIARAATILRILEAGPLGLGAISDQAGLPRSTVQRIIKALVQTQLVISVGPRMGFALGPTLLRLAAGVNTEIDAQVRPFLQRLSRDLGETVDLSVRQGRNAVFIDQITGSSRLVAVSAVGQQFPLYCTANGKALLACLDGVQRRAVLSLPLEQKTSNTIVSPAEIEAQIDVFLQTGLAFDFEEHADHISAVGTSFLDPLGRGCAISVPVPHSRFEQKRHQVEKYLLEMRDEIVGKIPGCAFPFQAGNL